MTFQERYRIEDRWWAKVTIMEIYHLNALRIDHSWTLANTAEVFECSVALVSENLKLAMIAHTQPTIFNIDTRTQALNKIRRY